MDQTWLLRHRHMTFGGFTCGVKTQDHMSPAGCYTMSDRIGIWRIWDLENWHCPAGGDNYHSGVLLP